MSSNRPQVTITLGRSGQAVKRTGSVSDASHADYKALSSKRPIQERLGNNMGDSLPSGSLSKSKRQRTENHSWSPSNVDLQEVHRVSRDDLRYKLLNKTISKQARTLPDKQNGDLREKLSRNSHRLLRFDAKQRVPDSRIAGVRHIHPSRSAEDLCHMDSLRKLNSFTSDRPRHRSPDRLFGASRCMSPPQVYDNLRHVPSLRSVDISRPINFITKSVANASRPEPLASNATIQIDTAKPVLRAPIVGSSLQKTSYMPEEPLTVASLLHSLGLGKYAIIFQAEEVDMAALRQMGDNDLKELGIPMGPRKKILLALLPRLRQRHP